MTPTPHDSSEQFTQPEPAVVRRILAALLDIVLVCVGFYYAAKHFGTVGDGSARLDGLPALGFFAALFAYFVLMEWAYGWTVGKGICRLRVVNADGRSISFGQSLMRNLVRIVDGLPVLYLVGFVAMMSDDQRRRLGDRTAHTVVVCAEDLVTLPEAAARVTSDTLATE